MNFIEPVSTGRDVARFRRNEHTETGNQLLDFGLQNRRDSCVGCGMNDVEQRPLLPGASLADSAFRGFPNNPVAHQTPSGCRLRGGIREVRDIAQTEGS